MDLIKKFTTPSKVRLQQAQAPSQEQQQVRDEIYTVIADAKIRELRETMAARAVQNGSDLIHFSDGVLTLEELQGLDEEEEELDNPGPAVDPTTLSWPPWLWYHALNVGGKAIQVCDYLGEHLADFFGITTPKYQLEIDERMAMIEEEKTAQEELQQWTGHAEQIELGSRLDAGDLAHEIDQSLTIISEQPGGLLGQGDASVEIILDKKGV